jgi:hypothetical protein
MGPCAWVKVSAKGGVYVYMTRCRKHATYLEKNIKLCSKSCWTTRL